jgi:hypothetical protein
VTGVTQHNSADRNHAFNEQGHRRALLAAAEELIRLVHRVRRGSSGAARTTFQQWVRFSHRQIAHKHTRAHTHARTHTHPKRYLYTRVCVSVWVCEPDRELIHQGELMRLDIQLDASLAQEVSLTSITHPEGILRYVCRFFPMPTTDTPKHPLKP